MVENANPSADGHFLERIVGEADARTEVVLVGVHQRPVVDATRTGSNHFPAAAEIEVGCVIVPLDPRREVLVAQTVVQGQFRVRPPGVLDVEGVGVDIVMEDERRGQIERGHVAEQQVGDSGEGSRASHIETAAHAHGPVEGPDIQSVLAVALPLVSELEAVRAFDPGKVVESLPDLGGLELRTPFGRAQFRETGNVHRREAGTE